MAILNIETDRLILRKFENNDMEALHQLLKDKEVNTFLPWFPVKDMAETKHFYETQFANNEYSLAKATIWGMHFAKNFGTRESLQKQGNP